MDWNRTQQVMHKWPPFAVPHVQLQQQPAIQHHIPHPQPHIQQPHPGLQHMQQPQPTQPQAPAQPAAKASRNNTPHCLVCNVHLGMFAKGGVEVFSDKVTTTHGKQQVHTILGNILNEELVNQGIHSSIICKKCFKLIDDIDALDDKITGMKQVVSNKYTMTLSLVKRGLVGKAVIDDDMKESLSKSARKDSTEEKSSMRKGRNEPPEEEEEEMEENVSNPDPDIANEDDSGDDELANAYDHDDQATLGNPLVSYTHSIFEQSFESKEPYSQHDESDSMKEVSFDSNVCDESVLTKDTLADHQTHRKMRACRNPTPKAKANEVTKAQDKKVTKSPSKKGTKSSSKKGTNAKAQNVSEATSKEGTQVSPRYRGKNKKLKRFDCEYCGMIFTTNRNLKFHIHKLHREAWEFKCPQCDKTFPTMTRCKLHIKTHLEIKPYDCDICGKSFLAKSTMVSHKNNIHLQERRFKCELCPKAFKVKRLLQGHVMSEHTGERPFKCQFCDAAFIYNNNLQKHYRSHTGEKPYNCDICKKSFSSLDNCRSHMFTHTKKRPYECTICGDSFMRKPKVLDHIIATHPNITNPEDHMVHNRPTELPDGQVIEVNKTGLVSRSKTKISGAVSSCTVASTSAEEETSEHVPIEYDLPPFMMAELLGNVASAMGSSFGDAN